MRAPKLVKRPSKHHERSRTCLYTPRTTNYLKRAEVNLLTDEDGVRLMRKRLISHDEVHEMDWPLVALCFEPNGQRALESVPRGRLEGSAKYALCVEPHYSKHIQTPSCTWYTSWP